MFHRGWFLVSVAESGLAEDVVRVVSRYGVARSERATEDRLMDLAGDSRWAGYICDGSPQGLACVARVRALSSAIPCLVLVTHGQVGLVNELNVLRAEVGVVPVPDGNLVGFAQRCLAQTFLPHDRVASSLAHLARERGLTSREVQLLSFSLGDEPRALVRRRLGICENTLKTQVRGLLRKCGERNLDALAKNLLRGALLGPSEAVEPGVPDFPRLQAV